MNTEQNYVGRADSANSNPQTAQNEAQPSILADQQQLSPTISEHDLHDAEELVLELVHDFMGFTDPVPAINSLVEMWVSQPYVNLASDADKRHLRVMLNLVTFLVELRGANATVESMTNS